MNVRIGRNKTVHAASPYVGRANKVWEMGWWELRCKKVYYEERLTNTTEPVTCKRCLKKEKKNG